MLEMYIRLGMDGKMGRSSSNSNSSAKQLYTSSSYIPYNPNHSYHIYASTSSMKFTAFAIAAFLGLATAAPTPASDVEKRYLNDPKIFKPAYNSLYSSPTGGLTYNPTLATAIFDKTTTITTFDLPAWLNGRNCRLGFYIDPADSKAGLPKAKGVQIFSTNTVPPRANVEKWGPPGNQRNQHYGNLDLKKPGFATVNDWPRLLEKFSCPTGLVAWEVVPKWDTDAKWDSAVSGLYITEV
jgi:hypothetical protein